jgi:Xaa-Pro aminopeptidase
MTDATATPVPDHAVPIAREEFVTRQRRAFAEAGARGLDALVVWSRGGTNADAHGDVKYLSNHVTPVMHLPAFAGDRERGYCAMVLDADGAVLVTDCGDASEEAAATEVRVTKSVDRTVGEVVRELGARRVGFAGVNAILATSDRAMRQASGEGVKWEPADDVLPPLRAVKSEAEIACLRESSRIGCGWVQAMLDACVAESTEGDVVGAGLEYLAANGGWPLDLAVASGPFGGRYRSHPTVPTWDSRRLLAAGDVVHIDAWGPVTESYFCDLARTTVVGDAEPTAAQLALMEDSITVVQEIVAAIRPGIGLNDLSRVGDEVVNRIADERPGERDSSLPLYGHGLGLEVELPFLTPGDHTLVEPGMVLAVECFLSEGDDGACFEDVILIGENGNENLTGQLPTRPWVT